MSVVAVIGANRGIGLALTERYAARGDQVLATARRPEQAEALNALAASSEHVAIHALDVLDDAATHAFAAGLGASSIDLLIANAGVMNGYGGIDDPVHDAAAWAQVLMTNVYGPFAVVRALSPALVRNQPGKVAILASAMGSSERGIQKGNAYPYRASKAAAVNLARNLAAELRPMGVAVGAYHPGWVRTDMGGPNADIGVEDSAEGLIARFDALSLATTGVFEDYRGEPLPF